MGRRASRFCESLESCVFVRFIIGDTAQQVGVHTKGQLVYIRWERGRDVHPERKGVGDLSNEENCKRGG